MVLAYDSGLQTHDPIPIGASLLARKARVLAATLTVRFSSIALSFNWLTSARPRQPRRIPILIRVQRNPAPNRVCGALSRSHETCSSSDADSDTSSQKPKSKKHSEAKVISPPKSKISAKSKVKTPASKPSPPSSRSEGDSSSSSDSESSDSDDGDVKKKVPGSTSKATKAKKTAAVSPKSESRGGYFLRVAFLCSR